MRQLVISRPEVECRTDLETVEQSLQKILDCIQLRPDTGQRQLSKEVRGKTGMREPDAAGRVASRRGDDA